LENKLIIRRIQYTGRSSYVVSLPKRWVISNGLDKNKALYMYILNDKAILLTPTTEINKKQRIAKILVQNGENLGKLIRKIIAYYIKGYDVIEVYAENEYLSPRLKNSLKERVKKLIFGSEFLDESARYLSIHIIASAIDLDISTVIKRMAGIAINMHRDTINALHLRNKEMLREIVTRDDDMDRLYFLSVRMLNQYADISNLDRSKEFISKLWELMEYRAVVRYLERVADHSTIIASSMHSVIDTCKDIDIDTLDKLNTLSVESLELAIKALIDLDIEKAEKAISLKPKVRAVEEEAIKRLAEYTNPRLISSLRISIESCRRVFEYSAGIAEIAINLLYK